MNPTHADYEEMKARLARRSGERAKSDPGPIPADEGPEWKLRQHCIKRLRERGYLVFCGSNPNIPSNRTEGEADLVVCGSGGIVAFMELKTAVGKLSSSQQAVKTILEDFGHQYVVVRSRAQLEAWLDKQAKDLIL